MSCIYRLFNKKLDFFFSKHDASDKSAAYVKQQRNLTDKKSCDYILEDKMLPLTVLLLTTQQKSNIKKRFGLSGVSLPLSLMYVDTAYFHKLFHSLSLWKGKKMSCSFLSSSNHTRDMNLSF